jgi:hypothetical protein
MGEHAFTSLSSARPVPRSSFTFLQVARLWPPHLLFGYLEPEARPQVDASVLNPHHQLIYGASEGSGDKSFDATALNEQSSFLVYADGVSVVVA